MSYDLIKIRPDRFVPDQDATLLIMDALDLAPLVRGAREDQRLTVEGEDYKRLCRLVLFIQRGRASESSELMPRRTRLTLWERITGHIREGVKS